MSPNKKIWLLHGINSAGEKTVDRLQDPLNKFGYDAESLDYPRITLRKYLFSGKKFNLRIRESAQQMKALTADGDCVVTYSNGALVVWDCMRLGRKFDRVICIAPALDRWKNFHFDGAKKILLLINPHDKALWLTRWLPKWHPGGRMGVSGMEYPESRVKTYAVSNRGADSHRFWFDETHLQGTANTINQFIRNRPYEKIPHS